LSITLCLFAFAALADARSAESPPSTPATQGAEITVLTYNIAGLPAIFSKSDPEQNIPLIGPLLNAYDIALVQEDFVYHGALDRGARHPYRSAPVVPGGDANMSLGDGLNFFSHLPFDRFVRVPWRTCHGKFSDGSDCFTPKGFTLAAHHLAPGHDVDVYNVHLDSGFSDGDTAARADQLEQLADAIGKRSSGRAVIVAGDTNVGETEDGLLADFLTRTGLFDACRSLACPARYSIDRVMFRGNQAIDLRAIRFQVESRFTREDGRDLSDHKAISVVFRWEPRAASIAQASAH
jgi:endonuclease/exonuclease/phosphatase family metal-dependent hydrolase